MKDIKLGLFIRTGKQSSEWKISSLNCSISLCIHNLFSLIYAALKNIRETRCEYVEKNFKLIFPHSFWMPKQSMYKSADEKEKN